MKPDLLLVATIGVGLMFAIVVIAIDAYFPKYYISNISSAVVSVIASGIAIFQFREELKISTEIRKLRDNDDLEHLTKIQRDAVVRQKNARRGDLLQRRFLIIVIVVALVAVAEVISCIGAIL